VFPGLGFKVVGFETVPFQGFKGLALVMQGLPGFGEANAADAGGTGKPTRFVFNVHDARSTHLMAYNAEMCGAATQATGNGALKPASARAACYAPLCDEGRERSAAQG
jgi:hypothetical protein